MPTLQAAISRVFHVKRDCGTPEAGICALWAITYWQQLSLPVTSKSTLPATQANCVTLLCW